MANNGAPNGLVNAKRGRYSAQKSGKLESRARAQVKHEGKYTQGRGVAYPTR